MATLGELVVRIGADTRNLNKSLARVQRNLRGMTSNITALGEKMTRSITLPIVGLGAAAVKSAADLETLETSFISLTGGAAQAANMVAQLNEFTAKTPFQLEQVGSAARQLIASGTAVGEVSGQLQFLGDIAATSGNSIEEIAAIFAKVNAKGKVELENLNQLAERSVPIFTALADATGLPADKLGAGRVSVQQFNEVLKGFAEEGGFAAGAMERLSQTAAGKFSTALDNLKQAAASIGKELLPTISKVLDTITALAQKFTQLDADTKRIAIAVAALVASFGPMLIVIPKIVQGLTLLTSPISATILAVGALVSAFVYFYDDIRPVITQTVNLFITLYNNIAPLRVLIAIIQTAFANAGKSIYTAFSAVGNLFSTIVKSFTELIQGDFSGAWDTLKTGLVDIGSDIFQVASDITTDMMDAINAAIYAEPIDLLGPDALPTKEQIMNKFRGLFGGVGQVVQESVTAPVLGAITEITEEFEDIPLDFNYEAFLKGMEQSRKAAKDFAQDINRAIESAVESMLMGTAQMLGAAIALGEPLRGVGTMLGDMLANLAMELGEYAIAHGVTIEAIKASLASLSGVAAIAAGVALIAIGAGLKARMQKVAGEAGVPALATGGLAFGPTTAIVGDNMNARIDPEVIAPLSKLKDMLGGNQVQVVGRISGSDILLANDRATRDRNRIA